MGKSNRIKTQKATDTMSLGLKGAKRQKKGMPTWAVNLITICCAVLILAGAAASIMASNGVFGRMQIAAKTENFSVNKNMMSYYLQTTYDSYSSQLSNALQDGVSLKDQYLNAEKPEQGTWHDYFLKMTQEEVSRMLVYCEEAKIRGIELDEEDTKTIDSQIEMLEFYAQYGGYELKSFLAAKYGSGVSEKDVRQAMELATLASKCATDIAEEIKDSVKDEDVNKEYADNSADYDIADYMFYSFTVTYKEAQDAAKKEHGDNATKEQILDKYKEMIAEARAKADAFKGKTQAEFNEIIINDIADDVYTSVYDGIPSDKKVESGKMPDAETEKTVIKAGIIAKVKELLNAGKKEFDEDLTKEEGTGNTKTYKVFDITVEKEYAELVDYLASTYFDNMLTSLTSYTKEKQHFTDKNADEMKWIFAAARAEGDFETFESGDGKKKGTNAETGEVEYEAFAEKASDLSQFKVTAYRINKPFRKNVDKTKNVAYILFSTKKEAEAALKKLSKGMTLADFEKLAKELETTVNKLEDYMASTDTAQDALDMWAANTATEIGDVTTAVLASDDGSAYAIALYYGDGHEEWFVEARDTLYEERVNAKGEELVKKHVVTYDDKVLGRLDIRLSK